MNLQENSPVKIKFYIHLILDFNFFAKFIHLVKVLEDEGWMQGTQEIFFPFQEILTETNGRLKIYLFYFKFSIICR